MRPDLTYCIESLGHYELPDELTQAPVSDVEDVLRRAALHMGWPEVDIQWVASVIPGSCMACTDAVAYTKGVALLVARPLLY